MVVLHSEWITETRLAHGVRDGRGDILLLLNCEIREDWNGKCFIRSFFRFWEVAFLMAEILEAGLEMERDGIIDVAADVGLFQGVPNFLAFAVMDADDVLVEDVAGGPCGGLRKGDAFDAIKQIVVVESVQLAFRRPFVKMREFDVEDDGLQRVHAEVAADEMVVVFGLGTVVAENFQAMGLFFIVCDNHAGIAEAA